MQIFSKSFVAITHVKFVVHKQYRVFSKDFYKTFTVKYIQHFSSLLYFIKYSVK